jgi:hypothetical protein
LLATPLDVHRSIADREFEESATSAGARAHSALGDARFFARSEALVRVHDFSGAQNVSVDIAAETGR